MDIEIGARVEDKNGKPLGKVANVVVDSWTGQISKFGVRTDSLESTVFYSPEDVEESTADWVKLKISLSEVKLPVQYGARVFDKNGVLLGKVNYLVSDPLTGDIKSFKVENESADQELIFCLEDVSTITPGEIRLKEFQSKSS